MTDSTLEAVLRRDRLVVAGALAIIIALAWGYVLWLANDMDMGGMDDGWNDGALGGTNDPHVRPRRATGEG
jgi:predicted metal-binding membrane protein